MISEDILDHEADRLQELIENRKLSLFQRIYHSRVALFSIAALIFIFQLRELPERLANSSLEAAIALERPTETPNVRLVVIDDEDYANLFQAKSPLNAAPISEILQALADGQAKAIVVDLDTSDPSFRLLQVPPVPIIWNAGGEEAGEGKFKLEAPLGGRQLISGSAVALAVVPRDERGVVRGYQHTYNLENGGTIDSPGYAAARLVNKHAPNEPDRTSRDMHFLDFRYRFVKVKARDLLRESKADSWKTWGLFRDQVVVLGGTYHSARDRYATPKGLLDGCEIVAQSVAAEVEGTYINSVSRWSTGFLMIAGGLVTVALYHSLKFHQAFLASLLFIPLLSVLSNWILFHRFAAWGAMVPVVIVVIIAELYSKAALYMAFYQRVSQLKTGEATAAEPS